MSLADIQFKECSCSLNGVEGSKIQHKYVNIYVKIADRCNARCKFCDYHDKNYGFKFDFDKFRQVLLQLKKSDITVNKISFTGGEPTTNITGLYNAMHFTRKNLRNVFIVVNTNGYNLYWLYGLHDEFGINSIALSRHYYYDNINEMIFGIKTVPNFKRIQSFQKKFNNIHLSCNLIKGYVDNQTEVTRYLEHAYKLGVYDVGFVGLMPITKFAETYFVDFSKIIKCNEQLCCNLEWSYKGICKCSNYLFLPKFGDKIVKFYARHRMKDSTPVGSNLFFDGENLMENFAGKIII